MRTSLARICSFLTRCREIRSKRSMKSFRNCPPPSKSRGASGELCSPPVPNRAKCSRRTGTNGKRAGWVPELRHRLRLDLADPLAGHAVDLADLVEDDVEAP